MANDTATPGHAGVILPCGRIFDSLFDEAIAPACAETQTTVTQIAAEFSQPGSLAEAHRRIAAADVIVADITARNPNVLYYAGYAHGLRKKVLLLARHGEDLPFARADVPLIIYAGDSLVLRQELKRWLQGGEAGTDRASARRDEPAPDAAREKFLAAFGDLLEKHGYVHTGNLYLENEQTFVLENQEMELALVQELARRARGLGIRLKLL